MCGWNACGGIALITRGSDCKLNGAGGRFDPIDGIIGRHVAWTDATAGGFDSWLMVFFWGIVDNCSKRTHDNRGG